MFGLRALDAVGARLALVFLATALAGIALAGYPAGADGAVLRGLAVFACAALVTVVLVRQWAAQWVMALIATGSLAAVSLSTWPPAISWDRSQTLVAWVIAGLSSGVAASRGPFWGVGVFASVVTVTLAAEQAHGDGVSPLIFLGAATYCAGGALTHVLARRGFAMTERALEAVETAETARQVAEERWRARRGADRVLHDTVLSTLTVLAHRGMGVPADQVRAACARDLAILTGGSHPPEVSGSHGPAAGGVAGPGHDLGVQQILDAAYRRAAALGLGLSVHSRSVELQTARLDPLVASALAEALAECVTNVWRHAGVDQLDLAVSVTHGALVVLVIDEGDGFDPARVHEDRLGLRASVYEPLSAVGGSVTVWSRPQLGTSVKLRVPLLAAVQ